MYKRIFHLWKKQNIRTAQTPLRVQQCLLKTIRRSWYDRFWQKPGNRSSGDCRVKKSPVLCCGAIPPGTKINRSEEHTSELQSREKLVCRLLLEKKNTTPR